jgi:dTDP-4-amino-4,6-dideoxygalactose transaminase
MSIINFKTNADIRGELTAIDSEFDLPFDIKRIFYIKDLDKLERGFHAHKKCIQLLVAIRGSFTLKLDDGVNKKEFVLNKSTEGVLIPLFHYIKMSQFSDDCIIMVICSYKYDEEEYIRDYDKFLEIVSSRASKNANIVSNFSLKEQTQTIKGRVMRRIEDIVDNNNFVMGEDVLEFENKFKDYNKIQNCVAVSSGCAALKISIKALQLKNTRVLIQANTYVAVPLVCEELNIPYEIIDIDKNLLLDLNKLDKYFENNIEKDIVVIVVHLYGNSVDMHRLLDLKKKHGFKLIEDAAQAHGSTYGNKKLGTFGDMGCFSFYPSKNLGAFGEGGAIITNNNDYATFCRYYRNYGSIEKYKWEIMGSNERMHNLQGGILSIKLDFLDEWNRNRTRLADIYIANINNSKIKMLTALEKCTSNYHLFIILTDERDALKDYLEKNNISCAIHYPQPFYETTAYEHINPTDISMMVKFKNSLLSLPMYPELTVKEVMYVCEKINKY